MATLTKADLNDPVTRHMHQDFTRLLLGQTVGEALDWLRQHPPQGRIVYFYVVDGDGRLHGVVPTRRLVLSLAAATATCGLGAIADKGRIRDECNAGPTSRPVDSNSTTIGGRGISIER